MMNNLSYTFDMNFISITDVRESVPSLASCLDRTAIIFIKKYVTLPLLITCKTDPNGEIWTKNKSIIKEYIIYKRLQMN